MCPKMLQDVTKVYEESKNVTGFKFTTQIWLQSVCNYRDEMITFFGLQFIK